MKSPTSLALIGFIPGLLAMATGSSANGDDSALIRARELDAPRATATYGGQDEGIEWWIEKDSLIHEAWKAWYDQEAKDTVSGRPKLPELDEESIMDEMVFKAFSEAWSSPSLESESKVKELWHPIVEDQVYSCPQFLSPEAIGSIRAHLQAIEDSGIPVRRPNGMNRYGQLLHPDIPGGATYPALDSFLFDTLVDRYVRPLGRAMFPRYVGKSEKQRLPTAFFDEADSKDEDGDNSFEFDDEKAYAFSIRYERSGDEKLNEHSDASVVTININLNLPNETGYRGSSLYFEPLEETKSKRSVKSLNDHKDCQKHVEFTPGMAVVHRGLVRHAALPIVSGERHQLIIWLFGANDYVRIAPYESHEQLTVEERWSPVGRPDLPSKLNPIQAMTNNVSSEL